jgi:hypothetical protein
MPIALNFTPSRAELRDAFLALTEDLHRWHSPSPLPAVQLRDVPIPLERLCGLLWNCSDAMPGDDADVLADIVEKRTKDRPRIVSYAHAARALKRAFAG